MSSTGGAIQQLSYALNGVQDTFLTGKPKHNFIKQAYKQYNNFAIERIKITSKNKIQFGKQITFEIKKLGDFLKKVYFEFSLPSLTPTSGTFAGWTNGVGYAIIDYVDIKINNVFLDRRYGLFMMIWNQLTSNPGIRDASDTLTGYYQNLASLKYNALQSTSYNVELDFWFGENIASALPLLSLSQTKYIEIILELKAFSDCIIYDGITSPKEVVMTDGWLNTEQIFVDDSFKRKFKGEEHIFVIKQLQYLRQDLVGSSKKINLTFNHPVSQLIFVIREQASDNNNDWFNFSYRNNNDHQSALPLITQARLLIDSKSRDEYLSSDQLSRLNSKVYYPNTIDSFIYTMPFCNKPAEWYPNGTLNFSMIQNPELQIDLTPGMSDSSVYIFAINFNFITIKDRFIKIEFDS